MVRYPPCTGTLNMLVLMLSVDAVLARVMMEELLAHRSRSTHFHHTSRMAASLNPVPIGSQAKRNDIRWTSPELRVCCHRPMAPVSDLGALTVIGSSQAEPQQAILSCQPGVLIPNLNESLYRMMSPADTGRAAT
jgi:hypothetical protein